VSREKRSAALHSCHRPCPSPPGDHRCSFARKNLPVWVDTTLLQRHRLAQVQKLPPPSHGHHQRLPPPGILNICALCTKPDHLLARHRLHLGLCYSPMFSLASCTSASVTCLFFSLAGVVCRSASTPVAVCNSRSAGDILREFGLSCSNCFE
jgi:hypothetical protein